MAQNHSLSEWVGECIHAAFVEQLDIIRLQLNLVWECLFVLYALLWIFWVRLIDYLLENSTLFGALFYVLPAFAKLFPDMADTVL